MTKHPDINSKTQYVTFKAKTLDDANRIKNLKKLAIQDGLEIYDLMSEAIDLVFFKHHMDLGGNPQLTLANYSQAKLVALGKCSIQNCKRKAAKVGLNLLTKKNQAFCNACFSKLPSRHDSKIWNWNQEANP